MDLSATHLHLLLNHVPTVGFFIGIGLFIVGLVFKSRDLKVAGLVTLVGISFVTIAVFVTGGSAQTKICVGTDVPGDAGQDIGPPRLEDRQAEALRP